MVFITVLLKCWLLAHLMFSVKIQALEVYFSSYYFYYMQIKDINTQCWNKKVRAITLKQ